MTLFLTILFAIELALLFTHEMDAVRCKEWQLFIGLKSLPEETAYWAFTLPHIFLYAVVLIFLLLKNALIFYVVDGFLIFHLLLHVLFQRHPNNPFTSIWSKLIILFAGMISMVHLILLILMT